MPQQNGSAATLRRIMQLELTTGRALVALARNAQRALVAGDPGQLDVLQPQQRSLVERQIALEAERQHATASLALRLGLDGVPTLSDLLRLLGPADAAALAALRTQMLQTERTMAALNQSNTELVESALGFVKFSLNALTTAALRPARYGVNMNQLAAPSFYIDSKA